MFLKSSKSNVKISYVLVHSFSPSRSLPSTYTGEKNNSRKRLTDIATLLQHCRSNTTHFVARMSGKSRGADTRGVKAKAQKAASAAEKAQRERRREEAKETAEWSTGSNSKQAARQAKDKERQAAKQASKQAKLDAYAADEEDLSKMRIKNGKGRKANGKKKGKLTAFQRQMLKAKKEKDEAEEARIAELAKGGIVKQQDMLKPNANQARGDGTLLEADSLEGALSVLDLASGGSGAVDKHPEKRAKAAFIKYRKEQEPIMREEYPHLKRSQIKERIWKMWQKSPDNPLLGLK